MYPVFIQIPIRSIYYVDSINTSYDVGILYINIRLIALSLDFHRADYGCVFNIFLIVLSYIQKLINV